MFDASLVAPYLDVRVSNVRLTAIEAVKIVPADPTRIYLAFSRTSANYATINISSNINQVPPLFVVQYPTTLELWWSRHGILVQSEWWGLSQSDPDSAGITIVEMMQLPSRDWEG